MSGDESFEVQAWDPNAADYLHIQTEADVRLAQDVARKLAGDIRIVVRQNGAIVRTLDVEP